MKQLVNVISEIRHVASCSNARTYPSSLAVWKYPCTIFIGCDPSRDYPTLPHWLRARHVTIPPARRLHPTVPLAARQSRDHPFASSHPIGSDQSRDGSDPSGGHRQLIIGSQAVTWPSSPASLLPPLGTFSDSAMRIKSRPLVTL